MSNSATSTKPDESAAARANEPAGGSGFHAWQFFTLAALMGATVVVIVSPQGTHPIALLLLSLAVMAAGLIGIAISRAVAGFFSTGSEALPLPPEARDVLEREKFLLLRSIKELEFDKGMGKVSEKDYVAIMGRLRARTLALMKDIERTPAADASGSRESKTTRAACLSCGTTNDADARFCKNCGAKLGGGR